VAQRFAEPELGHEFRASARYDASRIESDIFSIPPFFLLKTIRLLSLRSLSFSFLFFPSQKIVFAFLRVLCGEKERPGLHQALY
jgi:hypothetical protein